LSLIFFTLNGTEIAGRGYGTGTVLRDQGIQEGTGTSVVEWHHFVDDSDPTFHFDADPDLDSDPTSSFTHVGK
jgi:hypothetical protein